MSNGRAAVANRIRQIIFGEDDPRVRATWRVILAMPFLWILTGGILAGNLQSAIEVIPSGGARLSGLAQSILHGGFFPIALVVWARYLDRRPLSNYGVAVSRRWVRDFLVGFVAVIIGQGVWLGLSSLSDGKTIQVSPSTPDETVLFWLVTPFVALVLHAAVQQIVFFRVILENAAEGLHSRGMNASQAAAVAVPVAALFFVLMHELSSPMRVLDLAIVGGIFGLFYLHTRELALGIGAHFGALYAGTLVFAVIQVAGSLPGALGAIDRTGIPKMVLAYLVLLAWLSWS